MCANVLKNIFGGKKQAAAPTPHESISQLSETEDRLEKKQAYIEKQIQLTVAEARANAITNKRKALLALKKKKLYEKEQVHLDGVLSTIQFQKTALENATTNAEIFTIMTTAASALKMANKNMDRDKVEDIMEDLATQQELAQEVADLIANPGFGHDIDNDELLAELKELEEETLNEQMIDIKPIPTADIHSRLPEIPKAALPAQQHKKKEIDDMAELEQWAA